MPTAAEPGDHRGSSSSSSRGNSTTRLSLVIPSVAPNRVSAAGNGSPSVGRSVGLRRLRSDMARVRPKFTCRLTLGHVCFVCYNDADNDLTSVFVHDDDDDENDVDNDDVDNNNNHDDDSGGGGRHEEER